jgi:type II secretory ATPase GspE/PulE/Tfp pilus assembly ATPase PilB-like protein
LKDVGVDASEKAQFYRGKGCPKCMDTGYKGRIGIYELMIPGEDIHNAIMAKSSTDEIRRLALKSGMISLKEDGIEKIKSGVTTVEEVLRVTEED